MYSIVWTKKDIQDEQFANDALGEAVLTNVMTGIQNNLSWGHRSSMEMVRCAMHDEPFIFIMLIM